MEGRPYARGECQKKHHDLDWCEKAQSSEWIDTRGCQVNQPFDAHLAPNETVIRARVEASHVEAKVIQESEEERVEELVARILKMKVAGAVMASLLLIFTIVLVCLRRNGRENSTKVNPRTTAPTEEPWDALFGELKEFIAPTEADLQDLRDPRSPRGQALTWLLDDPITWMPDRLTRTVLERYVLGVLYFSTSGLDWQWSSYMSSADVCTWNNQSAMNSTIGISCDDDVGAVTSVSLPDNNLHGTIPWELVLLSDLRSINLDDNWIGGSIPSQIANLSKLEVFSARWNGITGFLPSTLPPFTKNLNLGNNFLSHSFPSSWGGAILEVIDLSKNFLTGTIPTTFGQLINLTFLDTSYNDLTGALPTSIGRLTNLVTLEVHVNALEGMIPSELHQISSLKKFLFYGNRFKGSVNVTFCSRSDGLEALEADCDEVECPCCTECCWKTSSNDTSPCNLVLR